MVKILERALAEVARLPEAAQEKIGRELLAHVEKLRSLRETVNRSIERGGSYTDRRWKPASRRASTPGSANVRARSAKAPLQC